MRQPSTSFRFPDGVRDHIRLLVSKRQANTRKRITATDVLIELIDKQVERERLTNGRRKGATVGHKGDIQ